MTLSTKLKESEAFFSQPDHPQYNLGTEWQTVKGRLTGTDLIKHLRQPPLIHNNPIKESNLADESGLLCKLSHRHHGPHTLPIENTSNQRERLCQHNLLIEAHAVYPNSNSSSYVASLFTDQSVVIWLGFRELAFPKKTSGKWRDTKYKQSVSKLKRLLILWNSVTLFTVRGRSLKELVLEDFQRIYLAASHSAWTDVELCQR